MVTPQSTFHEKLLDSLYDGVYFVDLNRKILYWNRGAELLTGFSAEEVVGKYCFDNILSHVSDEGCSLCLNGCPLAFTMQDGERREHDVYLRHKLGHRVPVSVRCAPIVGDDGTVTGAVEVFSDATAKRSIERRVGELEHLAFLDSLTGVPNRRYAELKVKQSIQEVELFGCSIGVLMFDVDHFKLVNDNFGHNAGDDALRSICKTITHHLRSGDTLGRWGGEEFLVIVHDISPVRLEAFANRCRILIAESTTHAAGQQIRVTVSAGATIIKPGDSEQSAIKRVDRLLYRSKSSGRDCITFG